MLKRLNDREFEPINRAYNGVLRPNRLSLGLMAPRDTHASGPVPAMTRHLERVQLAEDLGLLAGRTERLAPSRP